MEKDLNRSQIAALKAYPNVEQPVWDESYPKTLFVRHTERNAFIKGYEQAEKDLGWISVKERLPGPSDCVVACVEVDGICTCLTLATYNEETKEWHTDNWEDGEQEVYYPDYWMPIPTKIKNDEK